LIFLSVATLQPATDSSLGHFEYAPDAGGSARKPASPPNRRQKLVINKIPLGYRGPSPAANAGSGFQKTKLKGTLDASPQVFGEELLFLFALLLGLFLGCHVSILPFHFHGCAVRIKNRN
jgi:hypothetical protein